MNSKPPRNSELKRPGTGKRRPISVSGETLVYTDWLSSASSIPLVLRPASADIKLVAWIEINKNQIDAWLLEHGAILLRGFDLNSLESYERVMAGLSDRFMDYEYCSTPRSRVSGNIYTSTEYPSEQCIPLHNEMSYTHFWPMRLSFYCAQIPASGGETPIADSRKVYKTIDPQVRKKFLEKGVMYVRNYGDVLDLPWERVFQTTSKLRVEEYCRKEGINFEWRKNNGLRTHQLCHAVLKHPRTDEWVWFNQAHLFHVSSLPQLAQQRLLTECHEEDFPRQAYYGDGSAINADELEDIRFAYQQATVQFSWQGGDLLLLDNMLVAHGRRAFTGNRKVLVMMADPYRYGHILSQTDNQLVL
jgi:alpha-ketoglutarate-dependent taurine dioxygenase